MRRPIRLPPAALGPPRQDWNSPIAMTAGRPIPACVKARSGSVWPLWMPGQRAARGAAAQADLEWADIATRAARLRLAGDVREAAWALSTQQVDALQAESHLQTLQRVSDDVDRRVKAGDLAPADALAARAELLAAQASLTEATQRLQATRSQWVVLTGLEQPPEALEREPAAQASIEHPELLLAAQTTERARKRLDAVNADRRDPPELALRYRHEVPIRGEPSQRSIGVAVRLPFGTDDRNLPLQAAALNELNVAQAQEQRTRDRHTAEMELARASVRAAEQQLRAERMRAGLLRERAELIDRSFQAGESPLPELLRALSSAAQATGSVARQEAALGLARARLNQALGLLP